MGATWCSRSGPAGSGLRGLVFRTNLIKGGAIPREYVRGRRARCAACAVSDGPARWGIRWWNVARRGRGWGGLIQTTRARSRFEIGRSPRVPLTLRAEAAPVVLRARDGRSKWACDDESLGNGDRRRPRDDARQRDRDRATRWTKRNRFERTCHSRRCFGLCQTSSADLTHGRGTISTLEPVHATSPVTK